MLARVLASEAQAATARSDSALAPLYSAAPLPRPGTALTTAAEEGLPVPEPRPEWAIELGRFEDETAAVARLTEITLSDVETLADAAPEIELVRGRTGEPLYQVRFSGLAPAYATRTCERLRQTGRDCTALEPGI